MKHLEYIAKRSIKAVFLIVLIALLNFLIIRMAPGDPAYVIAGESGSADPLFMAQLREQFKLDEPMYLQLWSYLQDLVQFDLGFSHRNQAAVSELILARLPATLLLTGTGFVLAIIIGMILG